MSQTLAKRRLGRTNISISEISLGTTVIGYLYGLGPRTLPSEEEVATFLRKVIEAGVTFIDTAPYYQLAEERIAASGIQHLPGVIVSTKCGHILDRGENISDADLAQAMISEVEVSLRKFGVDHLELVQVHGGTAERIRNGSIIHAMQKLKDAGKVRFVGISTRGEEAPLAAIESNFFDTLQLAHSILDQRMTKEIMPEAKKHDLGIINRSVLMKGALTPASQFLASSLSDLKKNSDSAAVIAAQLGITLPQLAIRFALSNTAITTVLVGSNKFSHIQNALDAALMGPLPEDVLTQLRTLAVEDIMQVELRNWPPEISADTKDRKR